MSLTQTAPDDSIDLELGEVYYGGQKALEDQLANEIIVVIKQFIDQRFRQGRRPALRDAHAKDNGCVRATFRVDRDLKNELRIGVFKNPGQEYQAWIRFSNGNSEQKNSRFPDARGMAIKLMGVEGQKLLHDVGDGSEEKYTRAERWPRAPRERFARPRAGTALAPHLDRIRNAPFDERDSMMCL